MPDYFFLVLEAAFAGAGFAAGFFAAGFLVAMKYHLQSMITGIHATEVYRDFRAMTSVFFRKWKIHENFRAIFHHEPARPFL